MPARTTTRYLWRRRALASVGVAAQLPGAVGLWVLQIAPLVLAAIMLFYLIIQGNVHGPVPSGWGRILRGVIVAALALTPPPTLLVGVSAL